MIHGIKNEYLYSAKKVIAQWKKGENIEYRQGTGFFVQTEKGQLFFVTNRHVFEPGYSEPNYKGYALESLSIESYKSVDQNGLPLDFNRASVSQAKYSFDKNPNNDIVCLTNLSVFNCLEINCSIQYDFLASEEWINTKLTVCDTIAYPGFPEWFDHKNNTPIFRMGTIASNPRSDYCCCDNDPVAARVAYEGFSSGGASGSPVFAIQKGFRVGGGIQAPEDFFREVKVVGINAGHFFNDKGHSGISYFYKSSVIKNIIDEMIEN